MIVVEPNSIQIISANATMLTGHVLHLQWGQLWRFPQGKGTFLPFPTGWTEAAQALERLIGSGPQSALGHYLSPLQGMMRSSRQRKEMFNSSSPAAFRAREGLAGLRRVEGRKARVWHLRHILAPLPGIPGLLGFVPPCHPLELLQF